MKCFIQEKDLTYITKIDAYNIWLIFLLLPYGFEKEYWTSPSVYATQRSLSVRPNNGDK